MGCGASSGITVVEPVKSSNENEHNYLEVQRSGGGDRGDSAVSSHTTDSGLGLETAEGVILPGAVPRQLPPLRANNLDPPRSSSPIGRQESSEILEQLLNQGIIPAQSRSASSGQSYSIMMEEVERPRKRPPARLEKLMLRKEPGTTKEEIEDKMRQVEERRQIKEDALKVRLRTKSARPRQTAPADQDQHEDQDQHPDQDQTLVEDLRLDSFSEPRSPTKSANSQDDIQPLRSKLEEWRDGGDETGLGVITTGCAGQFKRDSPSTVLVNVETDSTFQQVEDIEEIF